MTPLQYVTEFETWYITKKQISEALTGAGFDIIVMRKDYQGDKFGKHWILCQKRS